MNELEIYRKLEELRKGIDPSIESLSSVKEIELGGEIFEERVWCEPYENSNLFVVLLEGNSTLIKKAYSLGLLVHPNKAVENLSNEQLWEIGIP